MTMNRTLQIFVWTLRGAAVWSMAAPLTPAPAQAPAPIQAANVPSYVPPNHPPVITTQPSADHGVLIRPQPLPVKMIPPDPKAGRVARPTVAVANENCVTSECHSTVKNY